MQSCSILSNYFRVEVIKTAKYFERKPGNHQQPFSPPPRKLSKVLKKSCFPKNDKFVFFLENEKIKIEKTIFYNLFIIILLFYFLKP